MTILLLRPRWGDRSDTHQILLTTQTKIISYITFSLTCFLHKSNVLPTHENIIIQQICCFYCRALWLYISLCFIFRTPFCRVCLCLLSYNIIKVTSHFQSLSVLHQTRSDITMLVLLQELRCKLTHHGFSSVSENKREKNTHTGVIFSNLTTTEKLCLAPNTDSDVFWTLIVMLSDVFVVNLKTWFHGL